MWLLLGNRKRNELEFTDDGIDEIASIAAEVNAYC